MGNDSIAVKVSAESQKHVSEDGKNMIVFLKIHIFDDNEDRYPFRMVLQVEGEFSLANRDEDKKIDDYYANALSILYPYARAIVSTYTASANIEPLILPTVNINKMLQNNE